MSTRAEFLHEAAKLVRERYDRLLRFFRIYDTRDEGKVSRLEFRRALSEVLDLLPSDIDFLSKDARTDIDDRIYYLDWMHHLLCLLGSEASPLRQELLRLRRATSPSALSRVRSPGSPGRISSPVRSSPLTSPSSARLRELELRRDLEAAKIDYLRERVASPSGYSPSRVAELEQETRELEKQEADILLEKSRIRANLRESERRAIETEKVASVDEASRRLQLREAEVHLGEAREKNLLEEAKLRIEQRDAELRSIEARDAEAQLDEAKRRLEAREQEVRIAENDQHARAAEVARLRRELDEAERRHGDALNRKTNLESLALSEIQDAERKRLDAQEAKTALEEARLRLEVQESEVNQAVRNEAQWQDNRARMESEVRAAEERYNRLREAHQSEENRLRSDLEAAERRHAAANDALARVDHLTDVEREARHRELVDAETFLERAKSRYLEARLSPVRSFSPLRRQYYTSPLRSFSPTRGSPRPISPRRSPLI